MKALRIAAIAGGIVVILLAVCVAVLYALFDADKIKGELTRQVEDKYHRKIALGKVELPRTEELPTCHQK